MSAEISLWPFQTEVISRIDSAFAIGQRRVLLVAPTGSGKTVIGGDIIANKARADARILFLAHRRELIKQASEKLHAVGIDHGIIQAGFPTRPGEPVQVASISTLHARAVRSSRMELPEAGLIVVDEAHHCPARTYRQIVQSYPGALLLGLTATPCRGDGRGLGDFFDVLVECPSVSELISLGYLVPTKVYAPTRPDLTGVAVQRGDYNEKQLGERMDTQQLVGGVVEHWLRLGDRRPTVVFATGVAHSVHLRNEFRAAGVLAEHVDASTPIEERDEILKRIGSGAAEVICNAAVLTEGWNCPTISCLVLARPTKHMGLYRQMTGRVLRSSPGKVDALILDHAGAVFEHGFPEEDVLWTLEPGRRAENAKHTARSKHRAPALTTCPECSAVRLEGHPCTRCGWRPQPKARAVDVVDGELGHVDRELAVKGRQVSANDKLRFYAQLLWIAAERSYQRGWAAHKYREKFGTWPSTKYAQPVAPDPEVRSWVRSRQIAWARARAKQQGAA